MYSRGKTLTACIAFSLLLINQGHTDQYAPELDQLFDELETSSTMIEIAHVQTDIWRIWYKVPQSNMHVQTLFDEGVNALAMANLDLAIRQFTQVVEAVPEFAEGWNRRATAYFVIGELEASLYDIQKTLALEPRHFGALSGLSMIFERRNEFDLAIEAELSLLELMPNNTRIMNRIKALEKRLSASKI